MGCPTGVLASVISIETDLRSPEPFPIERGHLGHRSADGKSKSAVTVLANLVLQYIVLSFGGF